MMKKADFDNLLKNNIIEVKGVNPFGYSLPETKAEPYENYYSKKEFQLFINEMKSPKYREIYQSYNVGKGSELVEKSGRYGKMPPKMASVASSSRWCYLALRDGAYGLGSSGTVKFEYECKINGLQGIAPQLDAFIPADNIYIEAKCHEIFDSHSIRMKEKYWNLMFGENNDWGLDTINKPTEEYFDISVSVFGIEKKRSMFDIKQLLCHLLGIASQKESSESATLVYLFFKPKMKKETDQNAIDEVFENLQAEILEIFNSSPIQNFIKKHNISLQAVAEYSPIMESLNENNIIILA